MIISTTTMKLFAKTAVLCAIPKLVNAAEKQITKLFTPNDDEDDKVKAGTHVLTSREEVVTPEVINKELNALVRKEDTLSTTTTEPKPVTKPVRVYDTHQFSEEEIQIVKQIYIKCEAANVKAGRRIFQQDRIAAITNTRLQRSKSIPTYHRIWKEAKKDAS